MVQKRQSRSRLIVEVQTDGKDTLFGTLTAPGGTGQRNEFADVAGLLNDEREYLPFTLRGQEKLRTQKTHLNKSQVVSIRLIGKSRSPAPRPGKVRKRCHLFLANGECVSGTIPAAPTALSSRLDGIVVDGDPFVTVLTDYGPILINRTKVVRVV